MPVRNLNHGTLQIKDSGAVHSLTVPVQEGNLEFTEKQDPHAISNRGTLYEFTQGQQTACAIKFDISFERWSGKPASGNPTVMDALKGRGQASAWTSTLPNKLNSPFGTDLFFTIADVEGTGGGYNEVLTFTKFVVSEFQFKEGADADKVSVTGMALLVTPTTSATAT